MTERIHPRPEVCPYCGNKGFTDLTYGRGEIGNYFCTNLKCQAHYFRGIWRTWTEWDKWINGVPIPKTLDLPPDLC